MISELDETLPPLPPVELRRLVSAVDWVFELDPESHAVSDLQATDFEAVFDFGCGCGRVARQLLVQPTRPKRYVGIDINPNLVSWCNSNLAPLDSGFEFKHHDVYSLSLGPDNTRQRTAEFPVGDGEFSLLIAHSVFSHLAQDQAEHYLREVRRILRPGGLAKTTWFLFSRESFPMLAPEQAALFINEFDPTNAVIFDWRYLRETFRDLDFSVRNAQAPAEPGGQWELLLEAGGRNDNSSFPSTKEIRTFASTGHVDTDAVKNGLSASNAGRVVSEPDGAKPVPTPATKRAGTPRPKRSAERVELGYRGELAPERLREICEKTGAWYHSYYLDNGFSVRGDYDIGADIDAYGFPDDLTGWRVLDVGSGAGWFSFYFEQLGADVTAVDARGYEDFDVYGRDDYELVSRPPDRLDDNGESVHYSAVNEAFWTMRGVLDSNVKFKNARVYELRPELFDGEKFDLVFLGSLLCHLRDPVGALMAAHRVCKNLVVAATPVLLPEATLSDTPHQLMPYVEFDKITWWLPDERCFRNWFLGAGFGQIVRENGLRLRCDLPRELADGRIANGDQQIRVVHALA